MRKKNNLNTLFNDHNKLIEVLNNGSDIACILIGLNFIEQCLTIVLKNRLRKSKTTTDILKPDKGFLGNYINKVRLAYVLKLIDKNIYKDLCKIAEIRNEFAHNHNLLTFSDPEIIKKCEELILWKKSLPPYFQEPSKVQNLYSDNDIAKMKFCKVISNLVNDFLSSSVLSEDLKYSDHSSG